MRGRKANLKKARLIFTIILVFVILAALRWVSSPGFIKQVIINKLENGLGKRVNIENISIRLLSNLQLFDITISNHPILERTPFIKLKETNIDYSLPSLWRKKLKKITIVEPHIWFENSQSSTSGVNNLRAKGIKKDRASSFFFPSNIVITNAHLERTDKPAFEINNLNIEAQEISEINSTFEKIYYIKLNTEKAKYGNFNANNIKADMVYKGGVFNIKKLESKIYEGTAKGKGEIKFQDGEAAYQSALEINELDLKKFCKDNLPPRYKVTGIIDGYISINGDKAKLQQLEGEFTSVGSGGSISSETFQLIMLHMPKGVLRNTLESIFGEKENFIYNEGRMKLGLLDGDVLVTLFLRGPKGKFLFDIKIAAEVIQTFLTKS